MATEVALGRAHHDGDPAEAVARVAEANRERLLRGEWRLRRADLEDCYSEAVLELVASVRNGREFVDDAHIEAKLVLRFRARVADRRRMLGGRSQIEAALEGSMSLQDASADAWVGEDVLDDQVVGHHDLRRLAEVANDLSADQRLVLACQISLGMRSSEFCERFGWSAENFRKTAQRARARLRVLVGEYERGERCERLEKDLLAMVAGVADEAQAAQVGRHLENCTACARTARELDLAQRGVAALLPLPLIAKAGLVAKLGALGAGLRKLMPFLENDAAGGAVAGGTAGAAAAGAGGATVAAGGSVGGVGVAKLAVVALCAGGAVGGYAVCEQVGLLPPAPRDTRPAKATTQQSRPDGRQSRTRVGPSPTIIATRRAKTSATPARTASPTRDAQVEREFGSHRKERPSAIAASSQREFNPGAQSASAPPRPAQAPSREFIPSGSGSTGEFGFE